MLSNVPYEFTRVAWYFGWPLGISDEFRQMMSDTPGMLEIGLAMALLGVGGSILTHGLVQGWGEVYPRWIWWRAGRRVPPSRAIVPAAIVAVVLIPAGLMNLRLIDDNPARPGGLVMPGVLWVGWGTALGVATYAYYLRRRDYLPPLRPGSRDPSGIGQLSSDAEAALALGVRPDRTQEVDVPEVRPEGLAEVELRTARSATAGSRRAAARRRSG